MGILDRFLGKSKSEKHASASQTQPPDLLKHWIGASVIVKDAVSSIGNYDGSKTMNSINRQLFGKARSVAEGNVLAFVVLTRATQIMQQFNSTGQPLEAISRAMNFLDGMPAYGDTVAQWRQQIADSKGVPPSELLQQARELEEELVEGAQYMYASASSLQSKT